FADQAVIAIENARLLSELRQRTDDLTESLEQQTATSEVLKVISSSPGELEPVFNAMLANATRICEAKFGVLYLREGGAFRAAVTTPNAPPEYVKARKPELLLNPPPDGPLRRITATKQVVQIADLSKLQSYLERHPFTVAAVELGRFRTALGVPMLKDGEVVGAITILRQEVRPFTDKQVKLMENFAAQAVIAIENTRLLNELRESLQQQTATADVLKVISSSPGTLEPVFSTMLAKATELCEASYGTLWLREGNGYRAVTMHGGLPPVWIEQWRSGAIYRPGPDRPMARAAEAREPIQVADMRTDPSYLQGDALPVAGVEIAGIRTLLLVPMFKESEHVGLISIYRKEVLPFTEKQIDLVKNFAAQAVIAIENTRLLSELRHRTDDLSEALEQQTATSEVLKVISSSPGELEPVFNAMLENATRICEATFGNLFLCEGPIFRSVAVHSKGGHADSWRRNPVIDLRDNAEVPLNRVANTKQVVHIPDLRTDQSYIGKHSRIITLVEVAGARTYLIVPMLKEGELVGAISMFRQEVRPFTDKQIELVKNFAAQAVIAIENARLLNELRQRTDDLSESLEQQVATSDVLRVISSSPTDVQPVFDSIAESAVRLCDGQFSFVLRFDGKVMDFASCCGLSAEGLDAFHSILPMPASEYTAAGRAIVRRAVVEIPDVETDPSYGAQAQGLAKAVTYRSIAAVPLLHEGNPIGAIAVARANAGSFPKRQIVLLQAFADQAVIAIANVRLFDEVQARTRELAKSLDDLRTTQDRLVQTQKLASLGQLTAGIAHEIKNPLNFVNNFSGLSSELIDELQEALGDVSLIEKRHSEITELMDTLRGNLDKVIQHGKRADAIVKNMLQHSREGSGEHGPVDINALVEECLSLAWHGARAEKQGFAITRKQSFDPSAGQVDIFAQDITRALLNLISNGFYAATKRNTATNGGDYEPTLTASTRNLGDRVEIRIRDNGTGIPPDVKEKMFNPFFTTKPTGEGTGLGLSISHDIIVKQHAGSIDVDTQPGEFTEIIVTLPRAAVFV
ncbi:MAG: GAF domain-containing protein, partial [Pseudolabrys sp.]